MKKAYWAMFRVYEQDMKRRMEERTQDIEVVASTIKIVAYPVSKPGASRNVEYENPCICGRLGLGATGRVRWGQWVQVAAEQE